MKNVKTAYEKILDSAKRNYSYMTEKEQKRIAMQEFAKFTTKGQTIGRNANGKLIIGDPDAKCKNRVIN